MANGREEVMAATIASLQLVYICIICNNIGIALLKLLYRIRSYRKLELLNAIAFCWCVGGVISFSFWKCFKNICIIIRIILFSSVLVV